MASALTIGVLAGDGIGPEVVPVAVDLAETALGLCGAAVQWRHLPMGHEALDVGEDVMPASTVDALTGCQGWIMGPHDNMSYPPQHRSALNPSGHLRKHFDLYANIRPAKRLPGTRAVLERGDLVVVRQNTEGFYADRNLQQGRGEFVVSDGVAMSLSVFTRHAIEKVAKVAMELAAQRRGRVAVVHKANVLPLTTGMYLEACLALRDAYPNVEIEDFHVDAMAARLVREPERFDVVVTENMFGDILSELASELAGGVGLAPSLNCGDGAAMAQAAHGAAPDVAGQGIANPIGIVLSTAMLLRWLGRHGERPLVEAAARIEAAVMAATRDGHGTPDMGGSESCAQFADAMLRSLEAAASE